MAVELTMLERIDQAIMNLKRGKQKLTISKIAEKASIARKTIYNRPELRQRCDQAIHIQEQKMQSPNADRNSEVPNNKPPLSSNKLLEKRYTKVKGELRIEQEKNAKLLENNRKLIIEKDQLKGRIVFLEERIEKMNKNKVKTMK